MDIEKGHLTIKTVVFIIASAISLTFSLTTIYWRFGQTEAEIQILKEEAVYFKERADRRLNAEVKILQNQLNELKKPNSDNEQGNSKKNTP